MGRRWLSGSSDQWGDQGSTHWNQVAQPDEEDIQVAPILADSEKPTSAKSSQCQYIAKQKQRAVLYTGAQKCHFALIHVLGTLLIEAPLGHCIFFSRSNKKRLSALELFLRGAYIRNYTVNLTVL